MNLISVIAECFLSCLLPLPRQAQQCGRLAQTPSQGNWRYEGETGMDTPREIIDMRCEHGTDELPGRSIDYLVIHYTEWVSSRPGTAREVAEFFSMHALWVAADFAVDDAEIVQYNPDVRNSRLQLMMAMRLVLGRKQPTLQQTDSGVCIRVLRRAGHGSIGSR